MNDHAEKEFAHFKLCVDFGNRVQAHLIERTKPAEFIHYFFEGRLTPMVDLNVVVLASVCLCKN
jgi:hypothetical protein